MNTTRLKHLALGLLLTAGTICPVALPLGVSAQQADVQGGLDVVGETTGLGSEDPRIIAARLIRTSITFLGVIAVVIVLYAGFVWMTAAGDEEKVTKAKKILISGGIGLMIILMSWSITTFVISSLLKATGTAGGGGGNGGSGGTGSGLGGGTATAFVVTRISPAGDIAIRNAEVRVTFSKNVDPAFLGSGDDAISVKNTATGVAVAGTRSVSGNTITFKPNTPCSADMALPVCFDEATEYTVTLTAGIRSTSGTTLSCTTSRPCVGTFTTGTLVDTVAPDVSYINPDNGDRVGVETVQGLQISAQDEHGVASASFLVEALAFDEVPAEGADLSDVTIETIWDTTGFSAGSSVRLSTMAYDLAGNSATDSVSVKMISLACTNGLLDSPAETAIDCGGDAAGANYCGACDGNSCTTSSDCRSGSACVNGTCKAETIIDAVSPGAGAVGGFVTISGQGFGSTPGRVYFTSAAGELEASLAPCSAPWTDTEVTVLVPEAAVGSAMTIGLVRAGATDEFGQDESGDANGPLLDDFIIDTVERPSLCSLSPASVRAGDTLVIAGQNLGESGSGTVVFGADAEAASYSSWTDTSMSVVVPVLGTVIRSFPVAVVNDDGIRSNALNVRFLPATNNSTDDQSDGSDEPGGEDGTGDGPADDTEDPTVPTDGQVTPIVPAITSINPGQGGIGRYVSLEGANFGSAAGTVNLVNDASGETAVASLDFPAVCSVENPWSDTLIRFVVPRSYINGSALTFEPHTLSVTVGTQTSNTVPFLVTDGDLGPNVCGIVPASGQAGDIVRVVGDSFGESEGQIIFSSSVTAEVTDWSANSVTVVVPDAAQTGSVGLIDAANQSRNQAYFVMTAGAGSGASQAREGGYAWSFSSGKIPKVPSVISECSSSGVSSVPNSRYTEAVCVSASVYARFSEPMNEATVRSAVAVEKCAGSGTNPCATTTAVTGVLSTQADSFTFVPGTALTTATTYRVTVGASAQSAEGVPLGREVQWTFVTAVSPASCVIDSARISPTSATINVINGTREFSAIPTAGCVPVDPAQVSWGWSVDTSFARFSSASQECNGGTTSCATVEALAEGETPVSASVGGTSTVGTANLTIQFTDPYVTGVWPNCDAACMNAQIGASFNIPMNKGALEATGAVRLFECGNELCSSTLEVSSPLAKCITVTGTVGECTGFALRTITLNPGKFYKVRVSGDVTSTSGVTLTRTNDGGDYSWVFRAREDVAACAVNRVSISPSTVLAKAVGDQASFTSTAYGEADSCSQSGQRLSGYSYSWTWADPITDEDLDNNSSTRVAEWLEGNLLDTSPSSVSAACSASCTAGGSTPYRAICGDGRLDQLGGEECEDGNVSSGDGCSASCLREGSVGPTCGNGAITLGEDCDDANLIDGDGCSSKCLSEGARSVGATCGNNDIAQNITTKAGEECDDGNAKNGDGCSANCTNEGTPTLASVGGAVCGDGTLNVPAESCDDGNIANGDGCSAACLNEGSSVTCGDSAVSAGEDCDDGNRVSGDGCSEICLSEGSSTRYSSPSFCGDGVVGVGEYAACEAGVSGDGRIDPLQTAFVPAGAVFEVNQTTKKATAVIEVRENSSNMSTTAELVLACVAESDLDCASPDLNGVGVAHCCMPRPEVELYPVADSIACRNQAVYGLFTEEMDLQSFTTKSTETAVTMETDHMYLRLNSAGGICPAGYQLALSREPKNFLARARNVIVRFFTGSAVDAAAGDCLLPVSGYRQVAQADGKYKVYLEYGVALEPNASYTLVLNGDTNVADATSEGVRAKSGVAINATRQVTFNTGASICTLDEVQVLDTDADSPYAFTRGDEMHAFTAVPMSHSGVTAQEISPLSGVYDWDFSRWGAGDSTLFSATRDAGAHNLSAVATLGKNGRTSILAEAVITTDTLGNTKDKLTVGAAEVTAILCENPWPELTRFPWEDNALGEANGLASQDSKGWMNFATYYCRDAGVTGRFDDLPSVTPVRPPAAGTSNVLKQYLFEVNDGSGDAVGVRVVSNASYLSPLAWYNAQGFKGEPEQIEIDGFAAVRDGGTVYVAAPNLTSSGIYSNIYVISYNESASESTVKIFEEMLANMSFATNFTDNTLCTNASGSGTSDTMCSSDADCQVVGAASICQSVKAKVRRDTARLSDLTDVANAVKVYGNENGVCSVTRSQLCSSNIECPANESCVAIVPGLSAGTYVRNLSVSPWVSWGDILGGALGQAELPADPLNTFAACGVAGSPLGSYDAATCVDQSKGTFICPTGSHVYQYQTRGDSLTTLSADLEYGASWVSPIDDDGDDDGMEITVGGSAVTAGGFTNSYTCRNQVIGASSACGDGVIGAGETCELGERGGVALACDGNGDGVNEGVRSQVCNNSCTGFVDDTAAVCVARTCGNGVREGVETCDDGSKNGSYGFCGADCTRTSAFSCGDGSLAGGEACDCGVSGSMNGRRAFGGGACQAFNGTYRASSTASCAWDCSGPAPACGDGKVDSGEQCDGADEKTTSKVCNQYSRTGGVTFSYGQPCTADSECSSGVCGGLSANDPANACALGETRTRTCDDSPGASCSYGSWSACAAIGTCGDGTVDPDEECDDNNQDSSDSCTSACKLNVCGDGALDPEVEECDLGSRNGRTCSSTYGSSCTACTLTCRNVVSSGAFCGDGIRNGTEFCDGSDVPLTYFDYNIYTGELKTAGNCSIDGAGMRQDEDQYTCRKVGVCNGGSSNGRYCTIGGSGSSDLMGCSGGGTCVPPACSASCGSSCPLSFSDNSLLLTANQPGSRPASTVDLYNYDEDSTSNLPNAATITVPACTAVGKFVGSISLDKVITPDVYIVFVTDRSGSMDAALDGSLNRLEVAQASLRGGISELFDKLPDNMHIGLVDYSTDAANTGIHPSGATETVGQAESTLLEKIDEYIASGNTYTNKGLDSAKILLGNVTDTDNVRKIIVLLSDGEPSPTGDGTCGFDTFGQRYSVGECAATSSAVAAKNAGYEIYTIALTSDAALIRNMKRWSSNSFSAFTGLSQETNTTNGIDYAYSGSTASAVRGAYEAIINSITGVTVSLLSVDSAGNAQQDSATLHAGTGQTLPWPAEFICDKETEQAVPIQITFGGEGQVTLSDVKVEYCSP